MSACVFAEHLVCLQHMFNGFSRCFLCGRHSTGHWIACALLHPHFTDEETEAVNHQLSYHMVAKCGTWIQTLLWVLQSWFGWPGVSPRLYVWGPGVILVVLDWFSLEDDYQKHNGS